MKRFLLWLADTIDISDNLHRLDKVVSKTRNGLPSIIHAVVFATLTVVFAACAWYFDFQSTIVGLQSFTDLVIPSLPAQTAHMTWWIIAAFTVLPTFLEIFTAGFAKEDIKIMQIAILGFSVFDMTTDIPRAYAFSLQLWPQIQLLGWGIAQITYWLYFILILGFATLGFELMMIMFGYVTVCYVFKIFNGEGSYDFPTFKRPSTSKGPSVGKNSQGETIIIDT